MSRSAYEGRRVLVLGAAGFIGRWVARRLDAVGASVWLAVRDRAVTEAAGFALPWRGKVVVADLANATEVETLVAAARPSVTFNLAGYGVDPAERDEDLAYLLNARLPKLLAHSTFAHRDRKWAGQQLVHAGSGIEYGTVAGEITERTQAEPTTAYGRSKLAGTVSLSRARDEQAGFRCVTARLFTVYGPGEHRGRLLPSLLESARTGGPLALTSGQQRRDFTYVEDVADGLLRLGTADPVPGDVVNLATGRTTTVRKFAEIAAGILSMPADRLRFGELPTRDGEMRASAVDVSLLQAVTGWTPGTSVASGILRTCELEGRQTVQAPTLILH